jgi:hypothetical protein
MVKVDDDNVGYVLHFYEPFDFTAPGSSSYDTSALQTALERRTTWRNTVSHAPLIATEYGVNRAQPMADRLDWLRTQFVRTTRDLLPSLTRAVGVELQQLRWRIGAGLQSGTGVISYVAPTATRRQECREKQWRGASKPSRQRVARHRQGSPKSE